MKASSPPLMTSSTALTMRRFQGRVRPPNIRWTCVCTQCCVSNKVGQCFCNTRSRHDKTEAQGAQITVCWKANRSLSIVMHQKRGACSSGACVLQPLSVTPKWCMLKWCMLKRCMLPHMVHTDPQVVHAHVVRAKTPKTCTLSNVTYNKFQRTMHNAEWGCLQTGTHSYTCI